MRPDRAGQPAGREPRPAAPQAARAGPRAGHRADGAAARRDRRRAHRRRGRPSWSRRSGRCARPGSRIVWIEHIVHVLRPGRRPAGLHGRRPGHRRRPAGGGAARRRRHRRLPRARPAHDTARRSTVWSARHGLLPAVREVSLAVDEGEVLALVGANGAGKTTLLRTIAGAHPAAGGRVVFDGADITGAAGPPPGGRAGIALVPEGRRLFPDLTVEENLLVAGGRARPGPWNARRGARRVPDAATAAPAAGVHAVRRRAAGDRDRPGADDQPAAAAARRGLARPVAAGGRRRVRVAARADPRRRHRRPRRAGPGAGAVGRRPGGLPARGPGRAAVGRPGGHPRAGDRGVLRPARRQPPDGAAA